MFRQKGWEPLLLLCLLNLLGSSNTPYSYNLDSKGTFPQAAQHPEATGMVPAVLGLLVMYVLHRLLSHLTMGYPQELPWSSCCHWQRVYTIQYIQSQSDLSSHIQSQRCKHHNMEKWILWCCFPDSNMALIRNDYTPPTHLSLLCDGYPGSQIQRLAASVVSSGPPYARRCGAAARCWRLCTAASHAGRAATHTRRAAAAGIHPPWFSLSAEARSRTRSGSAFCWLRHQIFMAVCISLQSSNWVLYIQTWLTRSNSSKEWAN